MKKLVLLMLTLVATPLFTMTGPSHENPDANALLELRKAAYYALTANGKADQIARIEALIPYVRPVDLLLADRMQEKIDRIQAAPVESNRTPARKTLFID